MLLPVCVIGKNVETKLFSGKDPVGQSIKCGNNYFTIIGVLDKRVADRETLVSLGFVISIQIFLFRLMCP